MVEVHCPIALQQLEPPVLPPHHGLPRLYLLSVVIARSVAPMGNLCYEI